MAHREANSMASSSPRGKKIIGIARGGKSLSILVIPELIEAVIYNSPTFKPAARVVAKIQKQAVRNMKMTPPTGVPDGLEILDASEFQPVVNG
jgi:hypothetical protein